MEFLQTNNMEGLDYNRPLSLYIHVPFCHSKCDYCAFYSLAGNCCQEREKELYLDRLKASLKAINDDYKKAYHTIFIGGGNPGTLGFDNLCDILSIAEENGIPEEVTVEINPEDVTPDIEKLRPYVTRLSVGIQSLNERNLRILGRNASLDKAYDALKILSESSFDFNADIMTAIPGESIEDALNDIRTISTYNPDHISLYCLSFEEDTPLIKRACPIGEDKEAEFLSACWKELSLLGYEHYEISNFARKNKRSKHNSVYWNLGQYIGLGPTAESSLGYESIISMRNSEDLFAYIKDPAFQCERLNGKESQEEFLLVSLRIKDGIDKDEYKKRFSVDFDSLYGDAISSLDSKDYINSDKTFSLTESGMLKLDRIILTLAMEI